MSFFGGILNLEQRTMISNFEPRVLLWFFTKLNIAPPNFIGAMYNYFPFKEHVLTQVDEMQKGMFLPHNFRSKEEFALALNSALVNIPVYLSSDYNLHDLSKDKRELLFVCQCLSVKFRRECLKFLNQNSNYQVNNGSMALLAEYDKSRVFGVGVFNQSSLIQSTTNQLMFLSGNNIDGDFLYQELLCFLDHANAQNILYQVNLFINSVRVLFSEIKNKYDFLWFKNDDYEQTRWLWSYMVDHEDFYYNPMLRSAESYLHDCYHQSIAWFDFQLVSKPVTKYLYRNMKDAWAQVKKRRRDVDRNRKTYNFVMSTNAEQCLNELKEISGMDKNKLVEQAIEDLYEQMLGKSVSLKL